MSKLWLIASTTYRQRIRTGMFLVLTFGLPLLMIVAGAIPILLATGGDAPAAVGFVDQTGELAPAAQVTVEEELLDIDQSVAFVPFAGPDAAQAAFLSGEIGGYLLIPQGYLEGEAVTYFADEDPGDVTEAAMELFLQRALLGEQPEWVFARLQDPATYTYTGLLSGEQVAEGPGLLIRLLAPIVLALIFALAVFLGASQMGSAIIREKDSRAMEMVVTSLRPRDLVAGKVLGLTLLTLTQFAIWTVGGLAAAFLAFGDQVELSTLAIPWGTLAWGVALIIPAYFLFAFTAAGLGIIAGDSQQAQQLAGLVGVLGLVPLWFLGLIIGDPGGPLAVTLTLVPFTAPTVALVRTIFAPVPLWQWVAALAILLASLAAAVWFVTKIFRAAMLSYGQSMRPRQIWQVLTQA